MRFKFVCVGEGGDVHSFTKDKAIFLYVFYLHPSKNHSFFRISMMPVMVCIFSNSNAVVTIVATSTTATSKMQDL